MFKNKPIQYFICYTCGIERFTTVLDFDRSNIGTSANDTAANIMRLIVEKHNSDSIFSKTIKIEDWSEVSIRVLTRIN